MASIGYYPIKENEIKQIIKMVHLYYKKDYNNLQKILAYYNVNDNKKQIIYESFETCLSNKDNKYFDVFYGVCIAENQKIFRGHYNIENKSITQLINMNPDINKYTKKLEEFLIFKNNKYEFINYLKFTKSSGVYISYEKIKEIYNDYYTNIQVKKMIDTYYCEYSNKFLEILKYCLDNECGLLEAQLDGQIVETKKEVVNQNNINNVNSNIQVTKKEKKIVSAKAMSGRLIGYFLLWGLLFGIVYEVIYALITFNMQSNSAKMIIGIIFQGITAIAMWYASTEVAFTGKTIIRENISKVMIILTIFTISLCAISGFMQFATFDKRVDNIVASDTAFTHSEKYVERYYTDEKKAQYYEEKEKALKEAKQEAFKYLVVNQVGILLAYLAALPFEGRKIVKKVM